VADPMTEPLKVGDTGIIRHSYGRHKDTTGMVVTVARRWATVKYDKGGLTERFDKNTGLRDEGRYTSYTRFYTHAQWEHVQRVDAALQIIKSHGLDVRFRSSWSDDDVLALAEWLEARRD
jgi:hypothetical protein